MSRTLLLAVVVAASTSSAAIAQGEVVFRWKWDGAMRFTSESAECDGKFVTGDSAPARYYPQLDTELERTSLTRFAPFETELVKRNDDGQFDGGGQYYALKTTGGRVQVYYGSWNLTQTPQVITNTTVFVTLAGTLHNYSDIDGCKVTLTGTFVRTLEPDEEPPPYGYGD